jgi:hypothetical protein
MPGTQPVALSASQAATAATASMTSAAASATPHGAAEVARFVRGSWEDEALVP